MCAKVPELGELANKALKDGYAVVIGLQSTGEAGIKQASQGADQLSELVSAPKMVLHQFLKNHFPVKVPEDVLASSRHDFDQLYGYTYRIVKAWESGKLSDASPPGRFEVPPTASIPA